MQISGEGLEPGGQEQGMNIYGREGLPANSVFSVNVSGTAPPPNGEMPTVPVRRRKSSKAGWSRGR